MSQRLGSCASRPNCVSSREDRPRHRVDPLPFDGDPARAFERAVEAVRSLPRTRVAVHEADYLRVECRSALFRFVDDVEIELDAVAGEIHIRSASRLGYSDLGANRRRIERVRGVYGGG